MAITARSGQGFLTGGVSDTTPDWLGSYDEGYTAAQKQKETALSQQETKQRMAENAAIEQRRALEFANTQADRAAALKSYEGRVAPEEAPFNPQPGAGLMPEYQVPVAPEARAPSSQYDEELAGPTVSPAAQANLEPLLPEFAQLEAEAGVPAGYLRNISILESSGGLNVGKGKYVGMFQIGPEVAKDFGITPEQAKDPRVAARVAVQLAARNAQSLRKALGREPAAWELYLAHQQGASGAAALLKNPNGRAIDVMTSVYGGDKALAYRVIVGNGGDPNMTAGQFAQMWGQKYSGQPVTVLPPTGGEVTTPATVSGYTISATPEPGAMPITNAVEEFKASGNRERIYNRLRGALMPNVLGGVASWFGTQADKDARDALAVKNAEALQWFETPAVREAITNNPTALQEAAADPLAFYNKYKNSIGAAPATPGVQTQPAAPAAPATPGVQAPPPAAPPPGATTTAGVQVPPPPPAAPPPPTDLGLPDVAARDLIPGVGAADYAGLNDGTGSLATAIARTRTGEVPKTPDTGLYIVEPMRITNEMQQLNNQREALLRRFEQARALREFNSLNDIEDKIMQVDAARNLMQAMGIIAQAQQGDNNALAQAMSGLTQGRQRLQPRSDGTFNIYYDGQLRGEGIARDQIIASLRMAYDQQYQALVKAQADAAAERKTKMLESELKIREQLSVEEAKMLANIAAKRDEQRIKLENPEYNITVGDDGTVTAVPKTGNPTPIRFTPEVILDPDGEPVLDGQGNPRYKLVPMSVQGR